MLNELPKIVITGDRNFTDENAMNVALEAVLNTGSHELIAGGARGADTLAVEICDTYYDAVDIHIEHAQWSTHATDCPNWCTSRKTCVTAGHRRNLKMLNLAKASDVINNTQSVVLAFPLHTKTLPPEMKNAKETSRGTWNCVEQALSNDLPVLVVWKQFLYADPNSPKSIAKLMQIATHTGYEYDQQLHRVSLPPF